MGSEIFTQTFQPIRFITLALFMLYGKSYILDRMTVLFCTVAPILKIQRSSIEATTMP